MIVISGALVLVALVLLIIGVVGPDLTFVYASIAVSLVSLVFLVVGILQRRGETAPAAGSAAEPAPAASTAPSDTVTAVVPSQEARTSMRKVVQEPPAAANADEEPTGAGSVLVVRGRPRYHVEGCRYLSGKAPEGVDADEAREEGFTACGVCKPDAVLAAAVAAAPAEPATEELAVSHATGEEPVVEEDVPGVEVAPARVAKKAAARKAPARATKAPAATAAVKVAPAPAAAAKAPARAAVKAAKVAPAKAPSKAPSKAASAAAAATPAAAAAAKRPGSVVVIPDRGKFHKSECRFVRDADGAEVMSRTAAGRAGYSACGVCKP